MANFFTNLLNNNKKGDARGVNNNSSADILKCAYLRTYRSPPCKNIASLGSLSGYCVKCDRELNKRYCFMNEDKRKDFHEKAIRQLAQSTEVLKQQKAALTYYAKDGKDIRKLRKQKKDLEKKIRDQYGNEAYERLFMPAIRHGLDIASPEMMPTVANQPVAISTAASTERVETIPATRASEAPHIIEITSDIDTGAVDETPAQTSQPRPNSHARDIGGCDDDDDTSADETWVPVHSDSDTEEVVSDDEDIGRPTAEDRPKSMPNEDDKSDMEVPLTRKRTAESQDLKRNSNANPTKDDMCSICLKVDTNDQLRCGHRFHANCIWDWCKAALRSQRLPTCPDCRGKL
jgi:hypothetical protein